MTTKTATLQHTTLAQVIPRARRLVQHKNEMLVLTVQGFVLAFKDKTMVEVAEQWDCPPSNLRRSASLSLRILNLNAGMGFLV